MWTWLKKLELSISYIQCCHISLRHNVFRKKNSKQLWMKTFNKLNKLNLKILIQCSLYLKLLFHKINKWPFYVVYIIGLLCINRCPSFKIYDHSCWRINWSVLSLLSILDRILTFCNLLGLRNTNKQSSGFKSTCGYPKWFSQ